MGLRYFFAFWVFSLFLFCSAVPTHSADFLGLSLGYYDVLDGDDRTIDARLEYRPDTPVLLPGIKPWAGLELTSRTGFWAGGGLLYDWGLRERWHLVPAIGAGLYARGSSDKDLGGPILFRTQLELNYQFKDESRLGIAFSHLSNCGLDDDNPGAEVIGLYYHLPLEKLF